MLLPRAYTRSCASCIDPAEYPDALTDPAYDPDPAADPGPGLTCAMWLARRTERRRTPSQSLCTPPWPMPCRPGFSSVTLPDLYSVAARGPSWRCVPAVKVHRTESATVA